MGIHHAALFACMLVLLGVFIFQAKARIIMSELRAPLTKRIKARFYAAAISVWGVITAIVMIFALTRK